jgi:hypothetical protein
MVENCRRRSVSLAIDASEQSPITAAVPRDNVFRRSPSSDSDVTMTMGTLPAKARHSCRSAKAFSLIVAQPEHNDIRSLRINTIPRFPHAIAMYDVTLFAFKDARNRAVRLVVDQ